MVEEEVKETTTSVSGGEKTHLITANPETDVEKDLTVKVIHIKCKLRARI